MRVFWWCVALMACVPVEPAETSREAILGGAAAAQESSVFLLDLRFDTGASICSAVLVSPRVLLTAAHCVDPAFHSASSLTVRALNKPDTSNLMQSDTIAVTTITPHPQWNPADAESAFDLAVLLLERAPVGVTPSALSRSAPTQGAMVRVAGYGRSSAGDGSSSGTRRVVATPITQVSAAEFEFGTNGGVGICSGDSGGPSFIGGVVVGIHSRTESAQCGRGVDMRVDARLAFIEGFIAANDAPRCDADARCASGCAAPDPDCPCATDGVCNAGCGGADADCTCVANGRCEAECLASDPDCGCGADGACGAGCGLADVDCLDDGMTCSDAALCVGARCETDPRGFEFCTRSCAGDSECRYEMTCQQGVCRAVVEGDVQGGCSAAPMSAWAMVVWALALRRRRR